MNELRKAVRDLLEHVSFETHETQISPPTFSEDVSVSILPDPEDEEGKCNLHLSVMPINGGKELLEGMPISFRHESGEEFHTFLNNDAKAHVEKVPVGKYTFIFPDS